MAPTIADDDDFMFLNEENEVEEVPEVLTATHLVCMTDICLVSVVVPALGPGHQHCPRLLFPASLHHGPLYTDNTNHKIDNYQLDLRDNYKIYALSEGKGLIITEGEFFNIYKNFYKGKFRDLPLVIILDKYKKSKYGGHNCQDRREQNEKYSLHHKAC